MAPTHSIDTIGTLWCAAMHGHEAGRVKRPGDGGPDGSYRLLSGAPILCAEPLKRACDEFDRVTRA